MITISKSELCTMREEERMKTLNVYVFVVDIVIIDVICHLFECCYLLLLLLLFSMFVVVIVMLRFFWVMHYARSRANETPHWICTIKREKITEWGKKIWLWKCAPTSDEFPPLSLWSKLSLFDTTMCFWFEKYYVTNSK